MQSYYMPCSYPRPFKIDVQRTLSNVHDQLTMQCTADTSYSRYLQHVDKYCPDLLDDEVLPFSARPPQPLVR